jgi:hypothetical protein
VEAAQAALDRIREEDRHNPNAPPLPDPQ